MNACAEYDKGSPTVTQLRSDAPPEYWWLVGTGCGLLFLSTVIWIRDFARHARVGEGSVLLQPTLVMISLYWVFSGASLLGMVYTRGVQFLHCIANTYEALCCLAFFKNLLSYLYFTGYEWTGSSLINIQLPPACCCFPCLPSIKNSKANLKRLRLLIFQLIAVQTTVETFRVLAVFDCSFNPLSSRTYIMDVFTTFSFMSGIWPIIIVLRIDYQRLRRHKCIKKFLVFKAMILVSKFLAKILGFLAKRGFIKGHMELGASQRSLVWCNYVTMLTALGLQVMSSKLYSNSDYKHSMSKSSEKDEVVPEDEVYTRDENEIDDHADSELIIN